MPKYKVLEGKAITANGLNAEGSVVELDDDVGKRFVKLGFCEEAASNAKPVRYGFGDYARIAEDKNTKKAHAKAEKDAADAEAAELKKAEDTAKLAEEQEAAAKAKAEAAAKAKE